MIVKLNTYEGVPIGGSNFSDFLSYVRGFLGANFGFSVNALDNQGGYFEDDAFVYTWYPATGGNEAVFFVPSDKEIGSLFGKKDGEFFRFEVKNASVEAPQSYKWTVLLTDHSESESTRLLYENNLSPAVKQLPYRPLRLVDGSYYSHGYHDVRVNGIPQNLGSGDVSFFYSTTSPDYARQEFSLNQLTLGAEHPEPMLNGRYDPSFVDPENGISKSVFSSEHDSTLSFEHTNFSLDFGAHILLWRKVGSSNKFAYVPQDLGSSSQILPGHFKVLDFARGTIKLNISSSQLNSLLLDGESVSDVNTDITFVVVSAEHLKEESLGGVGHYYTRYGKIYSGDSSGVLLAEYIFDGVQNLVRQIPESDYFSSIGDLLLQDTNRRYDDGVILGIRYKAIPISGELEKSQLTRYRPDTVQFYYSSGIIKQSSIPNNTVRCIIETNPSSWYNRDVLDAEYFPVNRTVEAYYSLIFSYEEGMFEESFNPDSPFKIVDTVGLEDLNDVSGISTGDVVYYDGSSFVGRGFRLENLLDVQSGTPSNNSLLQYRTSPSPAQWRHRTLTQVLSGESISAAINYTTAVSNGLSSAAATTLVSKGYVDGLMGTTGGDLQSHISATDVHGSRPNLSLINDDILTSPALNRIIRRDSLGRAQVFTSSATPSTSTAQKYDIVNVKWIGDWSTSLFYEIDDESGGGLFGSNRLIRRDIQGRAQVNHPTSGSPLQTIATKGYVDSVAASVRTTTVSVTIGQGSYAAGSVHYLSGVAPSGYSSTNSYMSVISGLLGINIDLVSCGWSSSTEFVFSYRFRVNTPLNSPTNVTIRFFRIS